jgi:hypothetical protein
MNRALGIHLDGASADYALVERAAGQPPRVLASGRVRTTELPATFRTLSGGKPLRWGLAFHEDGHTPRELPEDWPLRHPPTEALLHPAMAAALWQWQLGRIDEGDLLLWLRAEELGWSRGEPGRGRVGLVPRAGTLPAALAEVLRRTSEPGLAVAVCADRQAPGLELLLEELRGAGHDPRALRPDPAEGGTDLAAAGAALATLDPDRPGVHAPAPPRRRARGFWLAHLLVGAALAASVAAGAAQEKAVAVQKAAAQSARSAAEGAVEAPLAELPGAFARALARREAVTAAFEGVLNGVPAGSLHAFEVFSAAGSSAAELRLELDEAATGFAPELLGEAVELRPGGERDGRLLWLGRATGGRGR